jgi:hypothetical protein
VTSHSHHRRKTFHFGPEKLKHRLRLNLLALALTGRCVLLIDTADGAAWVTPNSGEAEALVAYLWQNQDDLAQSSAWDYLLLTLGELD